MSSELDKFGRGFALFGAIIATIFSVIILAIGIFILADDQKDVNGTKKNRETVGWFLIAVSIIIIIISWVWVWATRKSTFLADVSGISGGVEIAKDIF